MLDASIVPGHFPAFMPAGMGRPLRELSQKKRICRGSLGRIPMRPKLWPPEEGDRATPMPQAAGPFMAAATRAPPRAIFLVLFLRRGKGPPKVRGLTHTAP